MLLRSKKLEQKFPKEVLLTLCTYRRHQKAKDINVYDDLVLPWNFTHKDSCNTFTTGMAIVTSTGYGMRLIFLKYHLISTSPMQLSLNDDHSRLSSSPKRVEMNWVWLYLQKPSTEFLLDLPQYDRPLKIWIFQSKSV